ncbi:DUF2959 domain-containing protein [Marinobacterium jannaschii]|uniref:DUF2959 domain-containing protein n=1 Tax=Marinobacterium jannaschii TaxID=64970 RepID=UPI00048036DE|nr:DUF2959 domain-containing protein [Marinobacterium jannaschii]
MKFKSLLALPLVIGLLSGCSGAYYSAMEQVGIHKRDILVDRVEEARDAQSEAQEQFQDALEQFRSVVQFDGGELSKQYNSLKAEYDDSVSAAESVNSRIDNVETVAEDLFEEWQQELTRYSNSKLRSQSARKLQDTRRRYRQLLAKLQTAEKRMQPVLATLQDNVLYLKHNLNARAVGELKGEFQGIRQDISLLVRDMQNAISESDAFIREMEAG